MLAKKEPAPPKEQGETIKPPDNVLASLRVQALDNATMSQLNIPSKTAGVVVSSVEPGGPAEAAGISARRCHSGSEPRSGQNPRRISESRAKIKKEELAVLLLSRQGNNLFVAVNPK